MQSANPGRVPGRMRRWRFGAAAALIGVIVGIGVGRATCTHDRFTTQSGATQPGSTQPGSTEYGYRLAESMSTPIEVVLPREHLAEAEHVFSIFDAFEQEMSEWRTSSPLAAVNRAAGLQAVVVPAELRDVIRRGLEFGRLSEGAFDITWAALWGLWDFKATSPRLPEASEVAARVGLVDFRNVAVDERDGTVRLLHPGMKIGLGGIAKGYALDRVAKVLRAHGVTDFMISAGGQTMVGRRRDGQPWRVGIRDPRGSQRDYFAVLSLMDMSVATSGDYESYFELDGVRYHHLLDPRTGYPARGLRSATVISADATAADALATALMILGPEKALALVDRLPRVEAVLVDEHGKVHTRMKGTLLEIDRAPTQSPAPSP